MCGTPLSPITEPAQAQTPQVSAAAATQLLAPPAGPGPEYDALFRSEDGSHRSTDRTQLLPPTPVSVDYRMAPPGTSVLPSYESAPGPQQPQDGYPAPHEYGGGSGGYQDGWPPQTDEDSDKPHRGVIYGTLGAVAVAVLVIIGLLYFGTPGPAAGAAANGGQASAPAAQESSGANQLELPSGLPVPTTTPPAAATTPPAAPTTTKAATQAPAGNSSLPLSEGSTGALVKYVQERLHQLGFYNGPDNSQFTQAVALGVQSFQASAKVQGDPASVVGRSTMTALVSAGSQPTLRATGGFGGGGGNSAADVKRLQEALNYAENAGLQLSGKYDATTWTQVARYQASVGLPPTGQVNQATWAKLQSGTLA
ncbi:MAG TPA: peptidoglycan-binding domain-containing protein [Actinocrinis sp.]|nr:peptidoglycan-binding domain-containing protein [Actinocrinis sp.]